MAKLPGRFEGLDDSQWNFRKLLLVCPCESLPLSLFTRAIQPKYDWSFSGDPITRDPDELGIPRWLRNAFRPSSDDRWPKTSDARLVAELQAEGVVEIAWKNTTKHVRVSSTYRHSEPIPDDEYRKVFFQFVRCVIHALPLRYTDILEDEIWLQLREVIEDFVFPTLGVLSDKELAYCLDGVGFDGL